MSRRHAASQDAGFIDAVAQKTDGLALITDARPITRGGGFRKDRVLANDGLFAAPFVSHATTFGDRGGRGSTGTGGAEFALHRPVVVVNTIAVNVSDVNDDAVIDGVRRTVNVTFSHLLGNLHVGISASGEPGRWDLHLRRAFGHHVAHFLAAEPVHGEFQNS